MISSSLNHGVSIKAMDLHHAKAFFDFAQSGRDDFIKWIPFISKRNTEEAIKDLIKTLLEKQANGLGYLFGLWEKDKIIGMIIVPEVNETANWAEIGYMIDKEHEGKGLIKEACIRLIGFLFAERNMQKIVICCDDRNERSIGLAKRLGFILEGNLRKHSRVNGELTNLLHFGLFKEEFLR